MASRAQYFLRIGGRLSVKQEKKDIEGMFAGIFGTRPKDGSGTGARENEPGDNWPIGFVLKDYSVCQWKLSIDHPWPNETMIDFRAEVHHIRDGTLYSNKQKMIKEVEWFYHYRDYKWHDDLTKRLEAVNTQLTSKFKKDVIERFWFRDWQWYCGNGGC
jgi:hypothetical protein